VATIETVRHYRSVSAATAAGCGGAVAGGGDCGRLRWGCGRWRRLYRCSTTDGRGTWRL